MFSGNLFPGDKDCFGLTDIDNYVPTFNPLHDAIDDVSLFVYKIFINNVSFGIINLLNNDLFGGLEPEDELAVEWYVRAISGDDSVESSQSRVLFFTPGQGINENGSDLTPESFGIVSVYPNPFNNVVNVEVDLHAGGDLVLRLYNVLGEEVSSQDCGYLAPGRHRLVFRPVTASGVYYLQVVAGNARSGLRKVVLIK